MTGLLTSPVSGTLVLALLLLVLLGRADREAREAPADASRRLLVALTALFTLQVVARFLLLYG